jgi:hypothetical protein
MPHSYIHIESVPSSDEIDNFAFNISIAANRLKHRDVIDADLMAVVALGQKIKTVEKTVSCTSLA